MTNTTVGRFILKGVTFYTGSLNNSQLTQAQITTNRRTLPGWDRRRAPRFTVHNIDGALRG